MIYLFFQRKTILFETLKFPSWHQFSIDFGIGSDVGRVLEVKMASRRSKNEPKTAEDGLKLETPLGLKSQGATTHNVILHDGPKLF